mgnify:CR=1 FL=1
MISFGVMLLAVSGMAVGALVANKPIKGSCGGIAAKDGYNCACAEAGKQVCDTPDAAKPHQARIPAKNAL